MSKGRRLASAVTLGAGLVSVTLLGGAALVLEKAWHTARGSAEVNLERTARVVESTVNRQLLQVDIALASLPTLITALSRYEGTMLFVSHDRHFLAALSNRVLELTPEGIHQYGGGYTEYVARTGQEAPGLRS